MKRFLLLLVVIFFLSEGITAQPPVSKAVPVYKKAKQLEQQGMYFEAIAAYKKAIQSDKKFDSSYLSLATLYLRISQNDSAILVLKNAIKLNPLFTAAQVMLGMTYRDYVKNSAEAMKYYTTAAALDSTNKEVWYALAWCSNDLKKYDDAIRYAERALNIDNSYRPAYNEMGHAYRKMEKYAEAITAFKKRLDISVNEQPLYYTGLCYLELKDKEGARRMYAELVKLQSKSADALKKRIDGMQ